MLKSFFKFSRIQRNGILLFFLIVLIVQLCSVFCDFSITEEEDPEKQKWLALQSVMDSMKMEKKNHIQQLYPFNPNFITDFKGYKLGMSVDEIDRLLAFRKTDRYVNSAEEFQQVTLVSDSLLKTLAPYFKFPDWVNKKKRKPVVFERKFNSEDKPKITIMNINEATQEDLMGVYGIGPALSERIVKEREKFGSFVSMDQLEYVWGLSPEVIENLNKHFEVKIVSDIPKININNVPLKDLAKFPYFRYALAKEIIIYRSMNGGIKGSDDLLKIKNFPVEKIKVIEKYIEY